jgi:hypothetical protein
VAPLADSGSPGSSLAALRATGGRGWWASSLWPRYPYPP